jgi:uncharacterized membrane protein YGL010W
MRGKFYLWVISVVNVLCIVSWSVLFFNPHLGFSDQLAPVQITVISASLLTVPLFIFYLRKYPWTVWSLYLAVGVGLGLIANILGFFWALGTASYAIT